MWEERNDWLENILHLFSSLHGNRGEGFVSIIKDGKRRSPRRRGKESGKNEDRERESPITRREERARSSRL